MQCRNKSNYPLSDSIGITHRHIIKQRLVNLKIMQTSDSEENDGINGKPAMYFKYAARTAKHRAQLCHNFSVYLEDVVTIEENFGKSLLKVSKYVYPLIA